MAFDESYLQGEAIPSCDFFSSSPCMDEKDLGDTSSRLRIRSNQILSWMQPGLVYPAPYQCAINIVGVGESFGRGDFAQLLSDARVHIHAQHGSQRASACLAFAPSVWARFCEQDGLQVPADARFEKALDAGDAPEVVSRSNGVLRADPIDGWILVKADSSEAVHGITQFLIGELKSMGFEGEHLECVFMNSREQHSGCIHYTQWDDKDGVTRYGTEILADKVDFLSRGNGQCDEAGENDDNKDAPEID
jgi:hypothetical protein